MLIVSFPADEAGRSLAKAPWRGTAFIFHLLPVMRSVDVNTPIIARLLPRAVKSGLDHGCAAPQSTPMPIRLGFDSGQVLDRPDDLSSRAAK
jgi:hypothetical protein